MRNFHKLKFHSCDHRWIVFSLFESPSNSGRSSLLQFLMLILHCAILNNLTALKGGERIARYLVLFSARKEPQP